MTQVLFALEQIEKSHSEAFRLSVPRLEIREHQSLALIGPTGAGKTTLLRLLAGLDQPDAGKLLFSQRQYNYAKLPLEAQREITMVFQHPVLLTGTVRANVEYGLRLRRIRNRAQIVSELLERFRLTDLADQAAQTLSGGQKQLVALARALAIRPRILLLDEPTAHLDPARVQLIEQILCDYRDSHCATIVWSTHQLFQARRIAHHTAFLLNGKLIEWGESERIFSNAADAQTTAFIEGRMIY